MAYSVGLTPAQRRQTLGTIAPEGTCATPIESRVSAIIGAMPSDAWYVADYDDRLALVGTKTYSPLDYLSFAVVDLVNRKVLVSGIDYHDFGPATVENGTVSAGASSWPASEIYYWTEGMLLLQLMLGGQTYTIARTTLHAERLAIEGKSLDVYLRQLKLEPLTREGQFQVYLFTHPSLNRYTDPVELDLIPLEALEPYVSGAWTMLLAKTDVGWLRLLSPSLQHAMDVVGDTDYFSRFCEFVELINNPDAYAILFGRPVSNFDEALTYASNVLLNSVGSGQLEIVRQARDVWYAAWSRLLQTLAAKSVASPLNIEIRGMIRARIDPKTLVATDLRSLLLLLQLDALSGFAS